MAGEKSKKLLYELREELGDHSRTLVQANSTLYGKLTHYESEIMINHDSTREEAEINLVLDQSEYDAPEKFKTITKFDFNDDIAVFPTVEIDTTTEPIVLKLSSSETFKTGDKITIEGFVKPLSTHKISESEDPVIDGAYFYLLKQLVLSDYTHIRPDFQSKEDVEEQIKKKVRSLRRKNRATINNPFNNIQF